jgi:HK97 family phage major capsid protein
MLTYAKRLVDERDHLTEMANTTADRAAAEDRDLTDTERESLKSWQERCGLIDSQLEEHRAQIESQRSWAKLRTELDKSSEPPAPSPRNGNQAPAMETRSWGQIFTESEAFRTYGGRGTSEALELPGLFETRAPIDLPTLGNIIRPQIWQPPTPRLENPLLEVVGRQPVSVGSVEYFYFKPFPPPNAPEVAEGALKPEAAFTVEEKAEALKTYAHHKVITRQALEDFPRIRSIVDDRLRVGLFRAIEAAGVAALVANADIPDEQGDNLLEAIRSGLATVQSAGYSANAVGLNPHDWAALDIAILAATFNGPVVGRTFWGLTPVPMPTLASGTAYVGDFGTGMTYFDRNVTNVFASDSHGDLFLRNQLAILAETRALLVVTEPAALVKAEGAVAP